MATLYVSPATPVPGSLERDKYLYLQTGPDGLTWSRGRLADPAPLHRAVTELLRPGLTCRLLGGPGNAALIETLFDAGAKVQCCSPLALDPVRRENPRLSLLALPHSGSYSASLGGWHDVTAQELPAYRLASACARGAELAELEALFLTHPVARALTFVRTLDKASCGRLLGLVCDPRWFVGRTDPEKTGRMAAFLGLRLGHGGRPQAGENYELVQSAWQAGYQPTAEEVREDPRCFLNRIPALIPSRRPLRAAQRFVEYLRCVWLQALTPTVELFVPELFFKRADEYESYRDWIEAP